MRFAFKKQVYAGKCFTFYSKTTFSVYLFVNIVIV